MIMTVTGLLLGHRCDWSSEKVGSVWQKRPCSLTDLAPTLSKIYGSRWCAVLIKIDYRALLVWCPSVIVLLSRCSCSCILTILNSFLCILVPALLLLFHLVLYSSLCDKPGGDASDDDSKNIVTHNQRHAQTHTGFLSMTLLKEVIIIGGKSYVLVEKMTPLLVMRTLQWLPQWEDVKWEKV